MAVAASAAPESQDYVLLPAANTTLAAMLQVDRPLDGGQRLSAAIDRDRVRVWVGAADAPELAVTLRHVQAASYPALPMGDTALDPRPGPAPPAMLEQVVARLRAAKLGLTWTLPAQGVRAVRAVGPNPARTPQPATAIASRRAATETAAAPSASPTAGDGNPWAWLALASTCLLALAWWFAKKRP